MGMLCACNSLLAPIENEFPVFRLEAVVWKVQLSLKLNVLFASDGLS